MTGKDYLKILLKALIFDMLVSFTFYKSIIAFFVFLLPALIYPFLYRKTLLRERKRRLLNEFKESIMILSSFLEAGYSVENSFRLSLPEIEGLLSEKSMMAEEFRLILDGLRLNRPVEEMLNDFSVRSGLDDIFNFTEIFSLARKSGGCLTEIISHTSDIIREKVALKEMIHTENASKKYEQKIMNIIPFAIILYMNFSSPEFLSPLYEGVLGRIGMTVCLIIYGTAIYLSERILDIEV